MFNASPRHHSHPSNGTAITATEYLGGFDVISEGGIDIIYTDQNKDLQLVYSYPDSLNNGWYRAEPPIIAGNVKPGSPVSVTALLHGSYAGQVINS
jgi:hypothetical protein